MKKINFFKSIAVAALFMAVGNGAFAQTSNPQLVVAGGLTRPTYLLTDTTSVNPVTETATYGAIMPYSVKERASNLPSSLFKASLFKWTFEGTVNGVMQSNGTTAVVATAGLVADSIVTALMPTSGTKATIKVAETPQPKVGSMSCAGAEKSLDINLVKAPTLAYAETDAYKAICATDASLATATLNKSFSIAITQTPGVSNDSLYVDYEISATNVDGSALSGASTKSYQANLGPTQTLDIYGGQLNAVANAVATPAKYTVTIKGVWDGISWRAINKADIKTVPATSAYDLYVYAAPSTGNIKYRKQL